MGSRPRLGAEGRVRLPEWVSIRQVDGPDSSAGDVIGGFDFSDIHDPDADKAHFSEPFGRRADGLLLVESFARLDLDRPRKARQWFIANGVLDLGWFDNEQETSAHRSFRDATDQIRIEQTLVGQLMKVAERLTRTLAPPQGESAAWDPSWFSATELVFGSAAEAHGSSMARIMWELAMDSIRGYLTRAMSPLVDPIGVRPRSGLQAFPDTAPFSVGPIITYEWRSVLAPIYLQLYEALCRVAEGKPAARVCPECGRIFLILDGRRLRFCTNVERMRFNMRAYRARQRPPASIAA
jgi:hypothetical protein